MNANSWRAAIFASVALASASASAEEPLSTAPPPKPAAAPYSLPWQLRPILAVSVLRLDTSIAAYEDRNANGGLTAASLLTAAYKIPGTGGAGAGLSPLLRLAFVTDAPGAGAPGGSAFVNPLVGIAYAVKTESGFRFNGSFGVTVPVGAGGGNAPEKTTLATRQKGPNARAQMDNALFAVNDFTLVPGVDVAYVARGLTVQAEVTLLHLMRVRGEALQREASKTNLTMGVHVGYFVVPQLSIGAELRYQRWLNAPFAVEADPTGAARDNLTFAVGPRAHLLVGASWIRPGISYGRGLDKPMAAATPNYHIVQIDMPFFF